MESLLSVRDDVAEALAASGPVVAFESTVIAHGLPRPENLETARKMEAAVRAEGAVPATIGLFDGKLVVGLSAAQLAILADGADVCKVSRADLAAVLASGRTGATTVAGTLIAVARAGIRVLATGGIGGVHRGADQSFDISADLTELARTPVAVICSGAKAILDLPRTLELLETLGVPVVGYGTNEFPAFFSRESGLPLLHRVDSPEDAARLLMVQWRLGQSGQDQEPGSATGIVIANPPPAESALARTKMENLIREALEAAEAAGVRGKNVTPFLLQEIARASGGQTLRANMALLIANARLAAQIAVAYGKLTAKRPMIE